MGKIFKLKSVFEYQFDSNGRQRSARIEVFQSLREPRLLRGRVWLQDFYNLYPSIANTSAEGVDQRRIHSADEVSVEISTFLTSDDRYLTANELLEDELLNYFVAQIDARLK
jgi:hypothetical protein